MGNDTYTKEQRRVYNSWYREVVMGIKPGGKRGAPKKHADPKAHKKKCDREYTKLYKAQKGSYSSEVHNYLEFMSLEKMPINTEAAICSTFGCRNKLSLREQLFGTTCIHCQQEKFNPKDLL